MLAVMTPVPHEEEEADAFDDASSSCVSEALVQPIDDTRRFRAQALHMQDTYALFAQTAVRLLLLSLVALVAFVITLWRTHFFF